MKKLNVEMFGKGFIGKSGEEKLVDFIMITILRKRIF